MRSPFSSTRIMISLVGISASVSLPALADKDPKTDRVFRAKCAGCHGDDGAGATDQGKKMGVADMTSAAWQKQFSDDKIKAAINDGLNRDKNGKHQEMEGYKSKLRPDQVDALLLYIRALAAK